MPSIATLPVELLTQCCRALKHMEDHNMVDFELASYLASSVSAPRISTVRPHTQDLARKDATGTRPASALVALSETCHGLRNVAVPLVWQSLWLTLDFSHPNRCIKHCLSLLKGGHPAQAHAKDLVIIIKRSHDSISAELAGQLDTLLAHCVHSMPNLTEVYAEIDATRHSWPALLLSIMRLPDIRTLQFNGTAGVHLPRSLAFPLKSLTIDALLQRTYVDFLCFPALTHLTIGLEDVGKDENWMALSFPREMWAKLESLELHGFCRRPDRLFERIRNSMRVSPCSFRYSRQIAEICYSLPALSLYSGVLCT